MPVLFSVNLEPPEASLCICGDLDVASRDRLRRHLEDLRDCVHGAIRIDLENVTFVDCTCLRVFDDFRLDLVAAGRSLHLTSAQPCFHRTCALAGYDELSRMTVPKLVLIRPRRSTSKAASSQRRL